MPGQRVREKVCRALDARAEALLGKGATGIQYAAHWLADGRSIAGLARALAEDVTRDSLSRGLLYRCFAKYASAAQAIAAARTSYNDRQREYEALKGEDEAPPRKPAPAKRLPSPPTITLDDLRARQHVPAVPDTP